MNPSLKKITALAGALGVVAGCTTARVEDYRGEKPELKLEEYLNGKLEAHGFFQDRSGKIVKRFRVDMNARWADGTGTLEEDFEYSDGTKSRRVWTLKKTAEGRYIGSAGDVIGEAHGEAAGNAFRWKYTLDLPVGDKTYHVQFDDWMYLMNSDVMLNKSKMSKLGFDLGEVTLVFLKKKQ